MGWGKAFKQFCKTGEFNMTEKTEKFKINDLVEVPIWKGDQSRNWIIIDFASNGSEAVISNIFSKARSIILLSKLKLQQAEALGTPEDQKNEAIRQTMIPEKEMKQ